MERTFTPAFLFLFFLGFKDLLIFIFRYQQFHFEYQSRERFDLTSLLSRKQVLAGYKVPILNLQAS